MRICIFGASGLIGNGIFSELSKTHSVIGTFKSNYFDKNNDNLFQFNILNRENIEIFLQRNKPEIVINAAGITKHLISNHSKSEVITINSDFPRILSELSLKLEFRLIHISTDCVFDGKIGNYDENFLPNQTDLYGVSKSKSEVIKKNSLVIRTSTIGFEKNTKLGLLEWFLSQKTQCEGYEKAIFSGVSNIELGKIINNSIIPNLGKTGLFNIASDPINKYELLCKLNIFFNKNISISKNNSFIINRSLNSNLFEKTFKYQKKNWDIMLEELYR